MTSVASNKPDVIVVGAGLAGLTAALTVAELDFKPLILEAAAEAGGTTLLSEGVFNAFDPERQIRISVDDSPEKHLEQLLRWGAYRGNRTLAKVLCYEAPSTLKWLEHLGLELPENVVQAPASPYPRSHIPIKKGHAYVDLLLSEVKKDDCRCLQIVVRRTFCETIQARSTASVLIMPAKSIRSTAVSVWYWQLEDSPPTLNY